jgi:hypothetical protein
MGAYRKEWDCCGSVTETEAWEPESCPFCNDSAQPTVAAQQGSIGDDTLHAVLGPYIDALNYYADDEHPRVIEAFAKIKALFDIRASSAPVAPIAPDGWKPIETAPRTGRTLLLGCFNSMGNWRTMRGQWFTKAEIDQEWEETDGFEEGWYETAEEPDCPNCWAINPTHWAAIPPAPQQEGSEAGNGN